MAAEIDEASDIESYHGGNQASDEFISPLSRTSEFGTTNQKEALMKMIAQEMVQAFVEPEQEGENDDQILQSRFDEEVKHQRILKKAERRNRQNSASSDLSLMNEGSEKRRDRLKAERWSSIEGSEDLVDQDKLLMSPMKPVREQSVRTNSDRGGSTNSTSVIEDELSIEEIRRFVVSNIPQAVREQIPEEAWGKIFGGAAASKGGSGVSRRSLTQASNSENGSRTSRQQQQDDDDDDFDLDVDQSDELSAISGLTGLTSAFPDGRSVESRVWSMATLDKNMEIKVEDPSEPDVSESPFESVRVSLEEENEVQPDDATPRKKGVDFSTIEVRYYERTSTDNPAVTNGPAVGIGWNYKRGGRHPLKAWESRKGTPLKSFELLMDRAEREAILKKAGYSQKEIAEVVRICLKGRNQRQQTVNNLQHATMEEAVESAQQRIAKILRFGKKKSLVK